MFLQKKIHKLMEVLNSRGHHKLMEMYLCLGKSEKSVYSLNFSTLPPLAGIST